jgi:mannose-1-phosphate guanylyltransferase
MKAVIMAGGMGTRFWPASRQNRPKQFLQITSEQTMLQETVSRLESYLSREDIFVVSGPEYVEEIRRQIPWLKPDQMIVEPVARSTAACVGLAAKYLQSRFSGEVMTVLPSDNVIKNAAEFHELLNAASVLARDGWLVTFGIQPKYPATGYGYVESGRALTKVEGKKAFKVKRFREKPDRTTAKLLVETGCCFWNSGIFVWRTDTILGEIERLMPLLHETLKEVESNDYDWEKSLDVFSLLDSVPVDVGVLEKSSHVATIPGDMGWSDVGNWRALQEIIPADESEIVSNGKYAQVDSRGCILFSSSQERMVGLVGVRDLVVVQTPDALLICDRNRTEDVKALVEELQNQKLEVYL